MKEKTKEVIFYIKKTIETMIQNNSFKLIDNVESIIDDKFDIYYEMSCDGYESFIITFNRGRDGYSCKISFTNHLLNTIEREIIMKNEDSFMSRIQDMILRSMRDYLSK